MVMDPVILRDLRQDYQSGRLIIFAGAGVSAGGGLPNWETLAKELRKRVAEMGAAAAVLNEIDGYLQTKQLINAISAAKLAVGGEFEIMVRSLLDDKGLPVPPLASAIAGLKEHLRAVITTNLDRFLERAFEAEWPDLTEPTGDLGQGNHYILKMHGTLRDTRTWVFTRSQYDRAMFRSQHLQKYFKSVYDSHRLLFVGFGLADDNIELTLAQVRAISEGQPPMHYALLPEWEVGPSRRAQLSEAGIRLLTYSSHADAPKVLQSLAEGAAAPVAPSPASVLPLVQPTPPPAVAPAPQPGPTDTFVCYAPGDEALLREFEKHIVMLKRQNLISYWDVGLIGVGAEAEQEIHARLQAAKVILLLISTEFLAHEGYDELVAIAMERARKGEAKVIPILLRPCEFEEERFGNLQRLPRKKVVKNRGGDRTLLFVTDWGENGRDEVLHEIAQELRAMITGKPVKKREHR